AGQLLNPGLSLDFALAKINFNFIGPCLLDNFFAVRNALPDPRTHPNLTQWQRAIELYFYNE
ncbi:MAG: hypothetical protein AAB322_05525, partial [Pseudomonadota bacterium]